MGLSFLRTSIFLKERWFSLAGATKIRGMLRWVSVLLKVLRGSISLYFRPPRHSEGQYWARGLCFQLEVSC